MTFVLLGILNSQAVAQTYFAAKLDTADSSNGDGVSGFTDGTSYQVITRGNDGRFVKYSADGTFAFQKEISGSSFPSDVILDSSGNVYIAYGSDFDLIKTDSDGSILSSVTIATSGRSVEQIALDSSDNLFMMGRAFLSSLDRPYLVKLNSAFAIQWQKAIVNTGATFQSGRGVGVDSSGNSYISCRLDQNEPLVAKFNSAGTIQFQLTPGTLTGLEDPAIAVDSSDNFYTNFKAEDGSGRYQYLAKFNSAGILQWQKRISLPTFGNATDVAVDSQGNVYHVGSYRITTNFTVAYIAKFDSSGNIVWQRNVSGGNPSNLVVERVRTDPNDNILISGRSEISGDEDNWFMKIPNDGSLQQSFTLSQTYTYGSAGLSISNASLTWSSSSGSITTPTNTTSTNSDTLNASTLTELTAELG